MSTNSVNWETDPTKVSAVADSCMSAMSADRYSTRFYLQLRYARPTQVTTTGGSQGVTPMFIDAFTTSVKQLGYNTLMEVTDAATASICEKLRTRVEPVAAKPDIARLCTDMCKLQDGVLDYSNFHQEATSAFEDSYCAPCGFVLFETEPNTHEITCRRLDPLSVAWHRSEGRDPMRLYTFEAMSRDVLMERFGRSNEKANAIEKAAPWDYETVLGVDPPTSGEANTIRVTRAWKRRTGAKPGRYVMAIGNTVLVNEPWPHDFFPVVVARTRFDHKGFGGVPMARFIAPHHLAINRLARTAEESFRGAIPVVFAHKDSGVNDWKDSPFFVRKWSGMAPPKVEPTNPVSQQVLARIDYHDAKAYAQAGINKAIAAGQAPKGVVAAVAMREVVELADARKAELSKHWESMWRQAGHIIVALANEMGKVKISPESDVNGDLLDELGAAKLEQTDYRISYTLTSGLSKTVAGLLSDYKELSDLGFADAADMAAAVGEKIPDVAATVDRVTAYKRLAAKMVQDALERGEIPVPPSAQQGQQGLDTIVILGQQAWCQAMLKPGKHSPEQLETLRRLMRIAQAKKGAPLPVGGMIRPAEPTPQGALVGVGTPGAAAIAHNQYEAASLGITPGAPGPQAGPQR